jgi:syntaxin-binding protein 1
MENRARAGSIRQTARDKLLSLVQCIPGERKIVILDEWTTRVVDSVCSLHDILDCGAFLVEVITKKRQPYPTMQAVYFISPALDSFDIVAKDFGGNRATYGEVHILAAGRIGDEQMQVLANSPVVGFVKTLKEVYLDCLANESRIFTVGSNTPLGQSMALLDRVARQIAAACVTMGERPVIRYHRSQRDSVSPRLAEILNNILDEYCVGNPEFRPRSTYSELVIVSRTFDLISPILHEFTYQAMVMDLLEQKISGHRYQHGDRSVPLDESDPLWVALRHTHIAECSSAIPRKFRQFVAENKVASQSIQLQQQKSEEGRAEDISLPQLKEIIGSMGEFQEQKSQFTLHLDIVEECFTIMNSKHLMDVAKVEQKLACGCDAQGETLTDPWGAVAGILGRNTKFSSEDRARLLCLYFACCDHKSSESEKKALIESAKLEKVDVEATKRYISLLSGHWRPGRGDRKSRFQRENEEQYEISRYIPQIQLLLEDACRNSLDPQTFPVVSRAAAASSSQSQLAQSAATSLRGKPPTPHVSQMSSASKSIWFFVVGGATWSESRAVYQTARRSRMECYLGTTHMISAGSFLKHLNLSSV